MRSRALRGPNEATGALNQSDSRRRHSSRNALRRGQSGQSRPGLPDASRKAARLILEIVVVIESGAGTSPLRRRRTLQELRRVALARLARLACRSLGRVASDFRLQLDDIQEDIGLAAQLVGHHRWLGGNSGHNGYAHTAPLYRLDQGAEIAVAGEQHHVIDRARDFHRVDPSSISMLPLILRRPV